MNSRFWLNWIFITTLASLSLVILSHPSLSVGVWGQSEAIIIGLFSQGALSAMGLLGLFYYKRHLARRALFHPLVLFPLGIACISVLFSLTTTFPQRSLFGASELGEGVFWYATLGLLTASGLILKNYRSYRVIIGWYALIATFAITLLTIKGDDWAAWQPFCFTDYIAFLGLYLFVILITFFKLRSVRSIGLAYLCTAIPLLFSCNRSAQPLIVFSPLLFIFLHWFCKRFHARGLAASLIVLLPVSVVTFIMLVGYFFPPDSPFAFLTQSMWSRHNLFISAYEGLKASTFTEILMGHGWGSFTDISISNIPYEQTKLFMFGTSGTDKTFWDGLSRADFHSHSEIIESLISIGFIGMLFVVVYPVISILSCPKKYLPLCITFVFSYVLVSSFWFQMPLTLPFMALAMAGLGGKSRFQFSLPLKAAPALCLVASISLSWGAWQNYTLAKGNNDLADLKRGGQHLAMIYHSKTEEYTKEKSLLPSHLEDYADLRNSMLNHLNHDSSVQLQIVDLLSRTAWAYRELGQVNDPSIAQLLDTWGFDLNLFLQRFPHRTDLAVPFLSWQIAQGNEALAYSQVQKMYQRNPFDPVTLWFLGVIQLKDPNTFSRGISNMRYALNHGIQNIVPIEKSLIEELEEEVPSS